MIDVRNSRPPDVLAPTQAVDAHAFEDAVDLADLNVETRPIAGVACPLCERQAVHDLAPEIVCMACGYAWEADDA